MKHFVMSALLVLTPMVSSAQPAPSSGAEEGARHPHPRPYGTAPTAVLTWQDNSQNEDGFRVKRRPQAGGSYAIVGTAAPNVTTFSDPLAPGASICYTVTAFNSGGESGPSNEVCETVPVAPTPPTAPGSVTITITGTNMTLQVAPTNPPAE